MKRELDEQNKVFEKSKPKDYKFNHTFKIIGFMQKDRQLSVMKQNFQKLLKNLKSVTDMEGLL